MSTMIQPTKNKHGVYILRMAVPSELRITLGKSEIKRSLKTKELAAAKLNAPAVMAEMQAMLQQARRTLQAEQSITNDDIELVASVWATKILPQADLIKERYLYLYPYGFDLNPASAQLKRYLDDREQHSKQWQDKWNLDLMQLVQREIAEALEWTPIELTHAWRNELAWRLADRRNQAAEMLILDILPKHSATVKQSAQAQPSSITFSELLVKYQAHIRYAEPARAEKRIIEYSTAAGRFIEFIGAKPIDTITVKDMADFRILMEQQPFRPSKDIKQRPLTEQAKVEGKKISPERVRNLLMALSAIFTIAVENQWICSGTLNLAT
ncbi:DUF6538 domain-containing protein [Serratia oryzae]|uniref:DUF6538 domain-containing protein n=1 Tax=Serratia oryzae TaxID=2034155 RepID=UPI0012E23AFD|nr:DUF6538 domain-containing protein [Serratia oryzae]